MNVGRKTHQDRGSEDSAFGGIKRSDDPACGNVSSNAPARNQPFVLI
jgi:hypothetical protein